MKYKKVCSILSYFWHIIYTKASVTNGFPTSLKEVLSRNILVNSMKDVHRALTLKGVCYSKK